MLPSSHRLTIPLFKNALDKGRIFHSPYFTLKVHKTSGISRFSVAVSKKVAKSAVDRNRIRRRMYSILNTLYPTILPAFHGVFMMKPLASKADFAEMGKSTQEFFVKTALLK